MPFIALTETWLKSYISDAQLHMPVYVVSCSDRDSRIGGGVLLYSHINIHVCECCTFDDSFCEGIFCRFDTIKTCCTVVYRPPNAPVESFTKLLQFMTNCIKQINDDSYDINITGDCNLPGIDWETGLVKSDGCSEMNKSCALLSFMSKYFLSQYITCPTRGNNTLDIFLTNNDRLVTNINSKKTELLDHYLIDIMFAWNPLNTEESVALQIDNNSFRSSDFSKVDYDILKNKLKDVDWPSICNLCSFEEFPQLFTDTLFQKCHSCVPQKKISSGRPEHLNALKRKKTS